MLCRHAYVQPALARGRREVEAPITDSSRSTDNSHPTDDQRSGVLNTDVDPRGEVDCDWDSHASELDAANYFSFVLLARHLIPRSAGQGSLASAFIDLDGVLHRQTCAIGITK